ncbi:hypothetical protein ACFWJW_04380 [Streptomyces sp. NPDC127097]|uniref:hypothetical protein n=1 Tax=Streptomyces sp. NPDC127097 TaxID=3347136 RepID=UPI003668C402
MARAPRPDLPNSQNSRCIEEAMTTFLTPQQLAGRTSAAADGAVAAGHELGLTVTDPTVPHDVFSVVVHLARGCSARRWVARLSGDPPGRS